MHFGVILLFLLIAGVVYFMGQRAEAERRRELAAWAAGRGFPFYPGRTGALAQRFPGFGFLRQGSNQYAYNVVDGAWDGRGFAAFDYHYETYTHSKSGRRTQHHHFSVLVLFSDVPLKPLFVRPETVFDKVSEFAGFDDIDFESAEFSRRFFVKAPDRKWAYDVIHPRTMEMMLGLPAFSLQFGAHAVAAYRKTRFAIPDFDVAATLVTGILDGLPSYLVQQQKGAFDEGGGVLPAKYPPRQQPPEIPT